jgi:hypothetical protein
VLRRHVAVAFVGADSVTVYSAISVSLSRQSMSAVGNPHAVRGAHGRYSILCL